MFSSSQLRQYRSSELFYIVGKAVFMGSKYGALTVTKLAGYLLRLLVVAGAV